MHLRLAGLSLALLVALPLAGCLQDEPEVLSAAPEERPGHAEWEASESDAHAASGRSVPAWSVGDAWRYRVEGAWVGVPYTTTLGVLAVGPDRYTIGADHQNEVVLDVRHGGLFTRGIERGTLAVWTSGGWQDLIGFAYAGGMPWTVELYGERFEMRSEAIAGGVRATGAGADGHHLVVEFQWDEGWLTRFEWTKGDIMVLGYRLLDGGAPDGLWSWRVDRVATATATGLRPVQSATWSSDGSARFLILTATLEPATTGRASVWDPTVRPVLSAAAVPDSVTQEQVVALDRPGTWRLAATSLGGAVELTVHRVSAVGDPGRSVGEKGLLEDPVGAVVGTVDGVVRSPLGLP